MKVKAIWEFDVDVDDFDPRYVNIKGLAELLTRRELAYLLAHRGLESDDFEYKAEVETAKYEVNIVETYKRTVEVDAENPDDAYSKVEEMINNGEIDLPCDGGSYDYERYLNVEREV